MTRLKDSDLEKLIKYFKRRERERQRKPKSPPHTFVAIRGFDSKLYAQIKAQALSEGVLISDWLERAAIFELARTRKHQTGADAASA